MRGCGCPVEGSVGPGVNSGTRAGRCGSAKSKCVATGMELQVISIRCGKFFIEAKAKPAVASMAIIYIII